MFASFINKNGADAILDMVGGNSAETTLAAAALRARWVQIGRLAGARANVDFDLI